MHASQDQELPPPNRCWASCTICLYVCWSAQATRLQNTTRCTPTSVGRGTHLLEHGHGLVLARPHRCHTFAHFGLTLCFALLASAFSTPSGPFPLLKPVREINVCQIRPGRSAMDDPTLTPSESRLRLQAASSRPSRIRHPPCGWQIRDWLRSSPSASRSAHRAP